MLAALCIGAGFFLPQLLNNPFYIGLAQQGIVLGIAAVGIGFLMHQCGFVMFGVAAFVGLPAYLVGISVHNLGLSTAAAVGVALLGSTLFALLVGALVVRARPLPFAMLTLALAQMLKTVCTLQAIRPFTGGDDGLSMNFEGSFLGLTQSEFGKPMQFWPIAWGTLCVSMLLVWTAGRSRLGAVLRAIKSNEERMRFSGFDTYIPRLAAFALSCFVVSLSGVLIALSGAFASPELLDFVTGGSALTAMLVGGPATAGGGVLGALLYTWGQDIFGTTGHLELLTGIAMVVVIWFFPQGAMGFVQRVGLRLRALFRRGN
ncbi:branched-chain amino acid ABC transporter permease [Hydrogenophaga palleronii]|uniref:branched-chain amino acid ABC transporter permease n=1 Tax=Hydrogenophaga palleronii TaxID=65655 RepID=UPI0014711A87|nr:branched-chain amino acid ABC transporter permease [Hydrogenophaga palleronii]